MSRGSHCCLAPVSSACSLNTQGKAAPGDTSRGANGIGAAAGLVISIPAASPLYLP